MKSHSAWIPFLLVTILVTAFSLGCSDLLDSFQDDEAEAPDAPSNLTINPMSDALVVSWWDNSSTEDGFGIEIQIDNGSWALLDQVGRDNTDYWYYDPEVGVNYGFRVYAFLDDMESAYSNTAYYSLDADAPQNLQVVNNGTDWVELSWDDPSDNEDGYELEISEDGGNNWSLIAELDLDETSYTVGELVGGITYMFRIKAIYGSMDSAYSNSVEFTFGIDAPTNLMVESHGENWVTLSWDDPASYNTGFEIDRSVDEGSTWTELETVDGNTTTWTDYDVTPGVNYIYRVVTLTETGQSEPSSTVELTTSLYAPTDLYLELVDNNGFPNVNVTWQDNSSAEHGYTVERRIEGNSWEVVRTSGADVTSFVDESPYVDMNNYYRVCATTDIATSDYTDEAFIYISAPAFNVIASTSFEDMAVGYVPVTQGGISWNVIDRSAEDVGMFVADDPVYEGSRSAQLVDNSTTDYANVFMDNIDNLTGHIRVEMMMYCTASDKVANIFFQDTDGTSFILTGIWNYGTLEYRDENGWIQTSYTYPLETWFELAFEFDLDTDEWSMFADGDTVVADLPFLNPDNGYFDGTMFKVIAAYSMAEPIYIDEVKVGTVQ